MQKLARPSVYTWPIPPDHSCTHRDGPPKTIHVYHRWSPKNVDGLPQTTCAHTWMVPLGPSMSITDGPPYHFSFKDQLCPYTKFPMKHCVLRFVVMAKRDSVLQTFCNLLYHVLLARASWLMMWLLIQKKIERIYTAS